MNIFARSLNAFGFTRAYDSRHLKGWQKPPKGKRYRDKCRARCYRIGLLRARKKLINELVKKGVPESLAKERIKVEIKRKDVILGG